MLVYQAHEDLALALGDTIGTSGAVPTIIPDGARFFKLHRDNALYRAMLTVIKSAVHATMSMKRDVASKFILRSFPNYVKEEVLYNSALVQIKKYQKQSFILGNSLEFAYLCACHHNDDTSERSVPLPIKDHITALGLLNDRISQRADSFCTHFPGSSQVDMYIPLDESGDIDLDPSSITAFYLPYPTHPVNQTPGEKLTCEEMWYQKIIALAKYYCMSDSQEIDQSQFLQFEISDPPIINVNNQGT